MKPMRLEDVLFSQGFGTRRVCAGLVQQGYVSVNNELQEDPGVFFDLENLKFKVQGTEWPYFDRAYLMLHKPTGPWCLGLSGPPLERLEPQLFEAAVLMGKEARCKC